MWLALGIALAAPEFRGPYAEDNALAAAAWEAATACAGWQARHHPVVEIVYTPDGNGWAGHAWKDAGGLFRIEIHRRSKEVVVHEVAHAWPHARSDTPDALTEGLTDLLARCVARTRPELALTPKLPAIAPAFDLVFWTNPSEASGDAKRAGYASALALTMAAAEVVGEGALWPSDPGSAAGWPWLFGLLQEARPVTERHWAVLFTLGPGIAEQDLDGDGIPTGRERELGLYPWAFDSDEDGIQDGLAELLRTARHGPSLPAGMTSGASALDKSAQLPRSGAAAFALPLDGRSVCSGWRAARETDVRWDLEGDLAGATRVEASTDGRPLAADVTGAVRLGPGQPLTVRGSLATPDLPLGASVLVLRTAHLEPDPDCPVPRIVDDPVEPAPAKRPEPPPDWLPRALEAGARCTGVPPSGAPLAEVRATVLRAASAWDAAPPNDLTEARRYLLAECIARETSTPLPGDRSAVAAEWLRHVRDRLPGSSETASVADLRAKGARSTDPVLRALLAADLATLDLSDPDLDGVPAFVERAAGMRDDDDDSDDDGVPDGIERWRGGHLARVLAARPVWACSGFRVPPEDHLNAGAPEDRRTLEAWDDRSRIVAGTGEPVPVWHDTPDPWCGEAGGLVWIAADGPARAELLAEIERQDPGNVQYPVPVMLGGAITGTWRGGVRVESGLLAWAARTRRWDTLVGLLGILAHSADLGVAPEAERVREELRVRFGDPLPPLNLVPGD